jgi:hypothetical protein
MMADFSKFYTLYLNNYTVAEKNLSAMTKTHKGTGLDNDIIIAYFAEFIRFAKDGSFYNVNFIYSHIIGLIKDKSTEKFSYNNEVIKSYKKCTIICKSG